ncbi:MAG: hypothetical protein ABIV51_05530 [Saprospiraceae bacterium]
MRRTKLRASFFLLLLSSPFWGTYLFFQIEKTHIHSTIARKIKLEEESLEHKILKIPVSLTKCDNAEFEWKEADEFRYRGLMYDVIKSHQIDDTIYFTCYQDTEEGRLFEKMEEIAAHFFGADPLPYGVQDQLMQYCALEYIVPSLDNLSNRKQELKLSSSNFFTSNWTDRVSSPSKPPPRQS